MARIYIYPSDVQELSDCSIDKCRTTIRTIKDAQGKKKNQHVTIKEYCNFEGVNEEEVKKALNID